MNSLKEYIDYYKEGDRVVFTALFHSKRGFCCGITADIVPIHQNILNIIQKWI